MIMQSLTKELTFLLPRNVMDMYSKVGQELILELLRKLHPLGKLTALTGSRI